LRKCGFCMTGHHHNCKPVINYYEKTWVCECPCRTQVQTQDTAPGNQDNSE
jgi:hypothetical protein